MLERLRNDLKTAMKSRDTVKVRVLRLVIADLHNRKIAAGEALDDEQIVAALRTAMKQRNESAEAFAAGGRPERAAEERDELAVIQAYLPALITGDELGAAVDEAIASTGAASPADTGSVMSELMRRHRGKIDGKSANTMVRERLAGAAEDAGEPG